jgi:hypothetical protein
MKYEIRSIKCVLLLALFVFGRCELKSNNMHGEKKVDSRMVKLANVYSDSENVGRLIEILERSDCYYGKRVGIEGKISDVYQAYEDLKENVSDSVWVKLSYSRSGVMRVYAYQALENNRSLQKQLKKRLENDSTKVCFKISDMESIETIMEFISDKN